MESPKFKPPLTHSSSRRRRTSSDSNSPEFEFWMVRNPSNPQPNLLSADELFFDGVLRPLHLLNNHHHHSDPNPKPISDPPVPDPEPSLPDPEPESGPGPELSTAPVLTASKRWRDIFKKVDKETGKGDNGDKEKDKKKERKGGGGAASSAELNINIWPFSRSRSAGNAYTRPKPPFGAAAGATRKVNSAPCSRSNSTGESKSRKWPPASPGRPGVHLGRSSPVWQVRRGGSVLGKSSMEPQVRNAEKGTKKEVPESRRSKNAGVVGGGGKAKVLNLNVPTCIGYRSHLSCRSDENSTIAVGSFGGGSGSGGNNRSGGGVNGGVTGGSGSNGGAGVNLFNLRSLFTKKVY